MDTPHISPIGVPKKEEHNNNHNDAITLGTTRKFTTNRNAIAPSDMSQGDKPRYVHPYKLFNFTNEKFKDVSNLDNDKCLSPDYGKNHNFKDRNYRGNQFGVRYDVNKIFHRPNYNFQYSNSRLMRQYPQMVKNDPWFKYNWSNGNEVNPTINIINNRQDLYKNNWRSHPYFYYRDQTNTDSCENPIFTMPHFLEGFQNYNDKLWILFITVPIALYILAKRMK